MSAQDWLREKWQAVGASWRSQAGHSDPLAGLRDGYGASGSVLRGLTGRSMEMAEVQAEVAAECRGQVLVVGRCDEAVRRLLAHVRGQPPAPSAGPTYREGFFTLALLPEATASHGRPALDGNDSAAPGAEAPWEFAEWEELAREADVLLYVFRRDVGWRASDARWVARLHATGLPLVLVEADLSSDPAQNDPPPNPLPPREGAAPPPFPAREGGPGGLGVLTMKLTPVADPLNAPPADVVALVERILAQRPKLGIPLAQEIPGCRPLIAQRAIRSGMLMTTLLGAEPIPLLDLPLQVALNWKLALQLAAIHGHPGLDHRSREMIGTVLWNLALRYVTQQVLKLAPVLGWIGSAALSGAGTWVLGNALVRYYQVEEGNGYKADKRMESWREIWAQWRQGVATRFSHAECVSSDANDAARRPHLRMLVPHINFERTHFNRIRRAWVRGDRDKEGSHV